MKGEFSQFAFVLIALVLAAAAEELLPAFAGVGFPLLLALTVTVAPRLKVLPGVMAAVGAGAFEDALASLPPATSLCFFAVAALLARKEYFPRPFLIAAFPLYELWAGMCASGPLGDTFLRMLVALPLGTAALALILPAVGWLSGKAGVDE